MNKQLTLATLLLIATVANAAEPRRTVKGESPFAPQRSGEPAWCNMSHLSKLPKKPHAAVRGGAFSEVEPNNNPATASTVNIGTQTGGTSSFVVTGAISSGPSPTTITTAEDNGSITLATATGLVPGSSSAVTCNSSIDTTPASGDFEFFAVTGNAGQTLSVAANSTAVDMYAVVYDSAGIEVAFDDDAGPGTNSLISYTLPADGTYFVSITSFDLQRLIDPFNSTSGPGGNTDTGSYTATIGLDSTDADYFALNLRKGDVIGASITATGARLSLYTPDGTLMMSSNQGIFSDPISPLPDDGNASVARVVPLDGRYLLRVAANVGSYSFNLQAFRPGLSALDAGTKQILFIDFDGATVNTSIFGGATNATLTPLSGFLSGWGLQASDESAVIDEIMATVTENLSADLRLANNGNYASTGIPGQFDIEIRNSRDHADPWGQPNVSRIVVGGTQAQLGINTIGIAESIDVGNFNHEETAVVLLDILAQNPAVSASSINTYQIDASFSKIRAVGRATGNVIAHEAGHYFGCFHSDQFDAFAQLMDQGGNPANTFGVGVDSIFGTSDDVDVDFGTDAYVPAEGFTGQQDTFNTVAFGLSTGSVGAVTTDRDEWSIF